MKRPLSFGNTMLAAACGVVIAFIVAAILMMLLTTAMIAAISTLGDKETVSVKDNTFLELNLGKIGGERSADGLTAALGQGSSLGLVDACRAIRKAAGDERVSGLYITDPGTAGLSWGSLKELRDAVSEFASTGKPVVSYATAYSQGGYYVASAGNRILLHPAGMVDFRGFGAQVMYYKELLDKLGIEMQLIRPESCSYKSAGEVYTLTHMSDANREQIRAYIGSNWKTVVEEIASSRNGLTPERLNQIADNLSGFMADDALRSTLVDSLCFETDAKDIVKERLDGSQTLALGKYASTLDNGPEKAKNSIALVYAEGNVVDGSAKGFADAVYGDDIVAALRQAADDEQVKAIVLRVNSPGGAATASESMTHAVIQARAKKPVVVSMGDLAASAGYEMSCMANCIVAQPTTITGSIGVFGTVPNLQRLLRQKIGLNVDTVATNHNATGLTTLQPLSPTARALWTRNVEDFYKTFVGRVAEGRGMTFDQVHAIARGRVWTGRDALQIGLVDTLGGLDVAIGIAASMADIDQFRVVEYPKQKDTWQLLSELLSDGDDDGLGFAARARLAWQYRLMRHDLPRPVGRMERDLRHIAQSEGLQARMPFIILDE